MDMMAVQAARVREANHYFQDHQVRYFTVCMFHHICMSLISFSMFHEWLFLFVTASMIHYFNILFPYVPDSLLVFWLVGWMDSWLSGWFDGWLVYRLSSLPENCLHVTLLGWCKCQVIIAIKLNYNISKSP